MKDPLQEIPKELSPYFESWGGGEQDYACHSDAAGIGGYDGQTLWVGVGGGKYEQKGIALASRSNLRGLRIEGRNIPQPLIDAAGEIHGLEHLQLGHIGPRSLSPLVTLTRLRSLYCEGARGKQELSIGGMNKLRSVLIGGDTDAAASLLRENNPRVRYLALGGTESANLRLPDLELLGRFPSIEYLTLLNVSVKSRSLEPCLSLQKLKMVIVNFARNWDRRSVEALRGKGLTVRSRMDEIRSQIG